MNICFIFVTLVVKSKTDISKSGAIFVLMQGSVGGDQSHLDENLEPVYNGNEKPFKCYNSNQSSWDLKAHPSGR